jgi:hypothetical protein
VGGGDGIGIIYMGARRVIADLSGGNNGTRRQWNDIF